MKNKILLIRPENVYNQNNYPPLSLISVGSMLERHGFEVVILNCALNSDYIEQINSHLADSLAVGITFLTSEFISASSIISYIKSVSSIPIIVGGWHPTLFAEQMADYEKIDYVIEGEGEEHIVNLVKLLKSGEFVKEKIFRRRILDIDSLPMPSYKLDPKIEHFINSSLTDKFVEKAKKPLRWLPYESSRGCPSLCSFCINVVANNNVYRKKSSGKVIEEVGNIVRYYKLNHLKFVDDNFFVDIKRARKICENILEHDFNITWDAECRCDYFNEKMLNDETLSLAKKSGMVQLTLGIESGSQNTLDLMKKGITLEQAEYSVAQCDKHGIIARSSFMIEVPGESYEDIQKTIKFVNKLRKYKNFTCGISTFRPYPKCELTDNLVKKGYLREPTAFNEWDKKTIVSLYTSAEHIRPWHINGEYSESAAYYLGIESSVRLGNHQIKDFKGRILNDVFRLIAKVRNKYLFYKFPIDKKLYKKFIAKYYSKT